MTARADALPGPRRARWLKTLHQWHWISAALSLAGMLAFAVTGVLLNHADALEAKPAVVRRQATMPGDLLRALAPAGGPGARHGALPAAGAAWAARALGVDVAGRDAEWAADAVDVSLPRPGGDAWLRIDRGTGEAEFEDTDRGWIAYLDDLHKGRHAGAAWRAFIDAFAAACIVFTITGLVLLQFHAAARPATWPVAALGVLLPLLVALLFIH
jgi:hypothetical protein